MRTILGFNIHKLGFVASLLLCSALVGCIKDEPLDIAQGANERLTFALSISQPTQVVTRSETTTAELVIMDNSYLIVFNSDGSYNAHEQITNDKITPATSGTASPEITFEHISEDNMSVGSKLVFVLNTQGAVVIDDTFTYATLNDRLPLTNYGPASVTHIAAKGIPMYGESQWNDATGGSTLIAIKRSVAKIQVQQAAKVTGTRADNFSSPTTHRYQIFNHAKNGTFKESVAGTLTDSDMNSDPVSSIATSQLTNFISVEGTTTYDQRASVMITEFGYSKKIIGASGSTPILESVASQNRVTIIICANNRYFYRLDLCGVGPKYIDILRNHHYKILIKEVNDDGYSTIQQALTSPANNVTYEIIDEEGHTTIGNGKYAISVGQEAMAGKANFVIGTDAATFEVASGVRLLLPAELSALPAGVTSKITIVNAVTEAPIAGVSVSASVLTDVMTPLSITLPASDKAATIVVKFKITLGFLEYFSEPIAIDRILPYVYDCHQDEIVIPINPEGIVWETTGDYSHFTITNNGTASFKVKFGDNVIPVSWKTWDITTNTYIASNEADIDAIPIFELKKLVGFKGDAPIIVEQLAPIYIGRWGSPEEGVQNAIAGQSALYTETMGAPLRKRAVIESVEEKRGGIAWGNSLMDATYHANHGLYITNMGGESVNRGALHECWKKSARSVDATQRWYLPAMRQLRAIWQALNEVGYTGNAPSDRFYLSSTEGGDRCWYLAMNDGYVGVYRLHLGGNVRCIRDL